MTPEEQEEKKKGVTIVGAGGPKGYAALVVSLLASDGFQVQISEEDRIMADPCMALPDDDNCQDLSDCYDMNNGRVITHTPPFYTQSKRDVYRNPTGKFKRGR